MRSMGLVPAYDDGYGNVVVDVDGMDMYGGPRRRNRRRARARRRFNRRTDRAERRLDRRLDRLDRRDAFDDDLDDMDRPLGPEPSIPTGWATSIIGGNATAAAAGTFTIQFVSQTDFDCDDFSASGTAGVVINSIQFGDQIIWQANVGGIGVENFDAAGGNRGFLRGRKIGVGSTVTITATAGLAADTLSVAIKGKKPIGGTC